MCAGGTPAGVWRWTRGGSATRCWWGCGPGWRPRRVRGGSSMWCWTRPAPRGRCRRGGCWTPRRSMTRWPPRTLSRCCAARSARRSPRRTRRASGRGCGRCCAETTTTPRAARLCATGRTPRRAGRWWQSSPRTPRRCLRRCGAGPSAPTRPTRPSCWPPFRARTSRRAPTTRCASRAASLRTGSYPPQTPTPATAARAPREASTATRATSRWTPTLS